MRNYWIVSNEFDFVTWSVVFNEMTISVDDLKEFVAKVVKASQKYQIAEVKAAPGRKEILGGYLPDYIARPDYSYLDYIDEVIQQAGVFPFFRTSWHHLPNNLFETNVCYYNQKGEIETQAVTNLGHLLREAHPELLERKYGEEYTADKPPVKINCGFLDIQDGMIKDKYFVLHIALRSDIWFPNIFGLLEEDTIERRFRNVPYDNSALAMCHTPRLNQFLLAVRQAALDIGASWELEPIMADNIKLMTTETGIKLDLQDDE